MTESAGSVNVYVVKNGSNDIAVSVLLNISAGTAVGKYTHCNINEVNSACNYDFHFSQTVTIWI